MSITTGYNRTAHPGAWHTYSTQKDGTERCRCGATLYPAGMDLRAIIDAEQAR